MPEEKITFGIKNVYYSKKTTSAGVTSFGALVAFPGASEISLPPVGDPVKVYADNIVYTKMTVNQGYDGNLSAYAVPDSFKKDILGMVEDANGVLVEDSNAVQSDFALIFEFDTDTAKTKRNVLYNCSAGRTDLTGKTKEESVDPEAFSIPITSSPLEDNGYVKASILGDSNNTTWANWLNSVYTPSLTAQYQVEVTIDDGVDPIEGALVICGGKAAFTNSSGKAYYMLPDGTYDILVSAAGQTAGTSTVTVSGANVTKTVTLV